MIIVTNTERYAVMKLAREAQLDDGQLELLVFDEKNMLSRFRQLYSVVTNHSERNPYIQRYQVQRATIETEKSFGVQIDGDPQGHTNKTHPLDIECIPDMLRVIVPSNVAPQLFARP